MLNPMMDLVKELRKMNESLTHKLDTIIQRMDTLIMIESQNKVDWYGDGR